MLTHAEYLTSVLFS